MKKLFSLLLLASLIAVVGCGDSSAPAPDTNAAENASASTTAVQGTLVTLDVPNMT